MKIESFGPLVRVCWDPAADPIICHVQIRTGRMVYSWETTSTSTSYETARKLAQEERRKILEGEAS